MDNIANLKQAADVLEELGYKIKLDENAVHIAIGGLENPFIAVMTMNDKKELVVTCQIAKLGNLKEDDIPAVQFMLLDLNTRVRPYAFGIISASDNPELEDAGTYPIVLTDSLPLVNLSVDELAASMDSLLVALNSSADALRVGITG